MQIGGKRWKIDLQAKQEANLMLSAVSLPGGTQRRRTAEDELHMRQIFKEGDIVSVCDPVLYSTREVSILISIFHELSLFSRRFTNA